jgi:hypothetical protein
MKYFVNIMTAATKELKKLLEVYLKIFPSWTFPALPLIVAATFQSMAWMSGPIFLKTYLYGHEFWSYGYLQQENIALCLQQ